MFPRSYTFKVQKQTLRKTVGTHSDGSSWLIENQSWPSGDPIFPESPEEEEDNIKKRGLVDKITSFFGRANGEGRGEERGEGSRSESSSVSHKSSSVNLESSTKVMIQEKCCHLTV